ncbi:MAG: SIR2 family protein [Desulfovibrionales bacterium]|nr:SIR2 family protein [Desulfovibrionales bacterium]
MAKKREAQASAETSVIEAEDVMSALKAPQFYELVEEFVKLLSQSRRAFLIGAGCSKCAGLPLMEELTQEVLTAIPSTDKAHQILQELIQQFQGAQGCTIEDYMSELVDFISIATRRAFRFSTKANVTIEATSYSAKELEEALAAIKQQIEQAIVKRQVDIQHHRSFVKAIHGRLQSGKSGAVQPVDYFTLNYDTLVEDALSLERIPIADGFNGGVTGWWSTDAYDERGVHARVFKVHGSIDWCLIEDDVLPSRIRPSLKDDKQREPVLIWPAATKYRETQRDPYAQIIGRLRTTLRPGPSNEVVLAIIGYSFGDSHINYELNRALHESDGRVSFVIFTSDDTPTGILKDWLDDSSVKEHVRIHANKGFFHADTRTESETPLPWWRFELLVRLLGGER